MTISKCLQLISYGIIAGYQLPRLLSRFAQSNVPAPERQEQSMVELTPYPDLQCNPGNEFETTTTAMVKEMLSKVRDMSLPTGNEQV